MGCINDPAEFYPLSQPASLEYVFLKKPVSL